MARNLASALPSRRKCYEAPYALTFMQLLAHELMVQCF